MLLQVEAMRWCYLRNVLRRFRVGLAFFTAASFRDFRMTPTMDRTTGRYFGRRIMVLSFLLEAGFLGHAGAEPAGDLDHRRDLESE